MMTEELFREDAYLRQCAARMMATDVGWGAPGRAVVYGQGGGQPGDSGVLRLPDGRSLAVTGTRRGDAGAIPHPADVAEGLEAGTGGRAGRALAGPGAGRGDAGAILHLADVAEGLEPGTEVEAAIAWERRYHLMRM